MKIRAKLIVIGMCCFLSACSVGRSRVTGEFSSPGLEDGAGIVIENDENSAIFALDDAQLGEVARVRVTPGPHALGVRYAFPRLRDLPLEKETTFNFTAAAGHSYRIGGKLAGNGRHYIWLYDQASGKRVAGMAPPAIGGVPAQTGGRSNNDVMDIEIVEEEAAEDGAVPGAAKSAPAKPAKRPAAAPPSQPSKPKTRKFG